MVNVVRKSCHAACSALLLFSLVCCTVKWLLSCSQIFNSSGHQIKSISSSQILSSSQASSTHHQMASAKSASDSASKRRSNRGAKPKVNSDYLYDIPKWQPQEADLQATPKLAELFSFLRKLQGTPEVERGIAVTQVLQRKLERRMISKLVKTHQST